MILGVSLAIKQLGLLLLPLMVVRLARLRSRTEVRRFVVASAVVPFVVSLPFLLWSFSGFVNSILFSLTRVPQGHPATGLAPVTLLGLDGTRIFMLALIVMIWWSHRQGGVGFWLAASLVILTLTQLNPVVFTQYYVWLMIAALLALAESLPMDRPAERVGLKS